MRGPLRRLLTLRRWRPPLLRLRLRLLGLRLPQLLQQALPLDKR